MRTEKIWALFVDWLDRRDQRELDDRDRASIADAGPGLRAELELAYLWVRNMWVRAQVPRRVLVAAAALLSVGVALAFAGLWLMPAWTGLAFWGLSLGLPLATLIIADGAARWVLGERRELVARAMRMAERYSPELVHDLISMVVPRRRGWRAYRQIIIQLIPLIVIPMLLVGLSQSAAVSTVGGGQQGLTILALAVSYWVSAVAFMQDAARAVARRLIWQSVDAALRDRGADGDQVSVP